MPALESEIAGDVRRLQDENRMYNGAEADYLVNRQIVFSPGDTLWRERADVLEHLRWLKSRKIKGVPSVLIWHGRRELIPFIRGERMLVEWMVRQLANWRGKTDDEEEQRRAAGMSDGARDDARRSHDLDGERL